MRFNPRTEVICDENIYFTTRRGRRTLGLANGSIGYIPEGDSVQFDDISELKDSSEYEPDDIETLKREVKTDLSYSTERDRRIDFGYAITVHKAQGSDFEHVILVISKMNPFITRELLYTAFTRPKTKLHFQIHSELKNKLSQVLDNAYFNSEIEKRKTLLFGYKDSPFKPYKLTLKNGNTIELDSKIELMIVQTLDMLDVGFEPHPGTSTSSIA